MPDPLRVRREQVQALAQPAIARLTESVMHDLVSAGIRSALCIPRALLRSRVEWGIRKGFRLGLSEEASIGVFVNLLFEIDPAYYAHPEASRILSGTALTDRDKVRELLDWVGDAEWLKSLDRFGQPEWPCE